MEKDASQPSDPTPTKSPTSSSSPSPPPPPPPPPLSSLPLDQNNQCHDQQHHEDFAANFLSLYHAIFPPKTDLPSSLSLSLSPSPSSSASSSASTDITTEHRLHQARLILEYQELSDHYDLCLARLQVLTTELESLRQENAEIRSANAELLKLLSLSSPAAIRNHPHRQISNFSPRSAVESGHFERRNVDRSSLPKSISVRSSGYIKVNQQQAQGQEASGRNPSRPRPASQLGSGPVQQRVFVPAEGKGEEEALEFEVYNQGMLKTELCNKWQETGTCPYGRHCQFAHGINELRPVIRHPRYKTEVCRMILAGDTCPYGHRCHFRHSLSEQERLLIPR